MKEIFSRKVKDGDLFIIPAMYGFVKFRYPNPNISPTECVLIDDYHGSHKDKARDIEGKPLDVGDMVVVGELHGFRFGTITKNRKLLRLGSYKVEYLPHDGDNRYPYGVLATECYKIIPEIIGNEQYTLMQLGLK